MKRILFLLLILPGLVRAQFIRGTSMGQPMTAGLFASPASLSGFTALPGNPSTSQFYTLTGVALGANNVTVTPPTNWKTSTDNVTFSASPITITPVNGTVNQPIYVAISSSAPSGPVSGNVTNTCVGAGVSTLNVVVTGTVAGAKDSIKMQIGLTAAQQSGWILLHGDPSDSVMTRHNASGAWTFSTVATANWLQFFGVCAATNNGNSSATTIAPANVMAEYWFSNNLPTAFADAFNSGKPKFSLTGLKTDGTTYTVMMSAASTAGLGQNTDYRVIGSTTFGPTTVNVTGNTTNKATFTTVTPDGTGTINFYSNSHDLNQDISGIGVITVFEN